MTEGKDPEGRRLSSQAAGRGGWSTFRFFSGITFSFLLGNEGFSLTQ